ncbi:Uncharacterised protein [Salmonella enterica subsp. enterica]|uniref:Uncharacterized protein n=1 Tax=Salmonella enterica I TaxID=59201 RepID=A0A447TSV4_SALET|nr:Uncharacterised protein [Salmonella enterica subsp. enterica]
MIRKSQSEDMGVYSGAVDEKYHLCPSLYRRTLLARERSNCTRRLFTRRANLGMGGKMDN